MLCFTEKFLRIVSDTCLSRCIPNNILNETYCSILLYISCKERNLKIPGSDFTLKILQVAKIFEWMGNSRNKKLKGRRRLIEIVKSEALSR